MTKVTSYFHHSCSLLQRKMHWEWKCGSAIPTYQNSMSFGTSRCTHHYETNSVRTTKFALLLYSYTLHCQGKLYSLIKPSSVLGNILHSLRESDRSKELAFSIHDDIVQIKSQNQ